MLYLCLPLVPLIFIIHLQESVNATSAKSMSANGRSNWGVKGAMADWTNEVEVDFGAIIHQFILRFLQKFEEYWGYEKAFASQDQLNQSFQWCGGDP